MIKKIAFPTDDGMTIRAHLGEMTAVSSPNCVRNLFIVTNITTVTHIPLTMNISRMMTSPMAHPERTRCSP